MNPFRFFPVYRREMKSYLTSPAVYVCLALFFFLSGLIFYGIVVSFSAMSGDAELRKASGIETLNFTQYVSRQLFYAINFLLIFIVPIFTMRLLAEEKKTGTFELLKSLPFTDWNIVTAKFLSAYTLVAGMLVLSCYYVLVMFRYGMPEFQVIVAAVLGGLLSGAAFTAIGLFASSLTENQIVAAITAFVALLGFYLIGDIVPATSEGWGRILELFSMRYHTEQFPRGLVRLEDVAYFVIVSFMFLFLTCRVLELRRWRV